MNIQDTIVALATASGSGAIAIIRLSGNDAISIADKVFKPYKNITLAEALSHTGEITVLFRAICNFWNTYARNNS